MNKDLKKIDINILKNKKIILSENEFIVKYDKDKNIAYYTKPNRNNKISSKFIEEKFEYFIVNEKLLEGYEYIEYNYKNKENPKNFILLKHPNGYNIPISFNEFFLNLFPYIEYENGKIKGNFIYNGKNLINEEILEKQKKQKIIVDLKDLKIKSRFPLKDLFELSKEKKLKIKENEYLLMLKDMMKKTEEGKYKIVKNKSGTFYKPNKDGTLNKKLIKKIKDMLERNNTPGIILHKEIPRTGWKLINYLYDKYNNYFNIKHPLGFEFKISFEKFMNSVFPELHSKDGEFIGYYTYTEKGLKKTEKQNLELKEKNNITFSIN